MKNLFRCAAKLGEKPREKTHLTASNVGNIESQLTEVLRQLSDIAHAANRSKNSSWYSLSENEISGSFVLTVHHGV